MTGLSHLTRLTLAMLIGLVMMVSPLRAADMLPIADGIPMMTDMTIVPDSLTSFETDSGRIETIQTNISKDIRPAVIRDFYRRALTALGWHETGAEKAAAFRRDSETLLITISASREERVIRFDLRPAGR